MSSGLAALAVAAGAAAAPVPQGAPLPFADLPGWSVSDLRPALGAFRRSCAASAGKVAPLRTARPAPQDLAAACAAAAGLGAAPDRAQTRRFFETNFAPHLVSDAAFFTGYYEPVVEGSLERTSAFATPLYAPPPDLVRVDQGKPAPGLDPALTMARRLADGRLAAMPDRAAIEAGALRQAPLVYLREPVEAFFVQVQGSARIRLTDGSLRRLVYAGRNGYPYTSIGKLLVARLHVPPADMGMTQLKAWIRANGQGKADPGGRLMQENRSYIFFRFDDALPRDAGPIGGEGVSLAPRASLAIDRGRWPYGLPFYVDTALSRADAAPDSFRRLVIGQDTGSAIVGPARADIFFGSGPEAAASAGAVRDTGKMFVLWPRETRAAR